MEKKHLSLGKLKVYQLSRNLSKIGWEIYKVLEWQDKKTMGDQFIRATDSVAANIAEGFGRFHFLDKIKFYFNARGSLLESRNWLELLSERGRLEPSLKKKYLGYYQELRLALSGLIHSCRNQKEKKPLIT